MSQLIASFAFGLAVAMFPTSSSRQPDHTRRHRNRLGGILINNADAVEAVDAARTSFQFRREDQPALHLQTDALA
jgi:hypothetical protein